MTRLCFAYIIIRCNTGVIRCRQRQTLDFRIDLSLSNVFALFQFLVHLDEVERLSEELLEGLHVADQVAQQLLNMVH